MMTRVYVPLLLLVLVVPSLLWAQNYTGTIRGTVTDASNAIVAGATVTVINTQTGATRTTHTSPSGDYVFPEMPVGTYEVRVKQTGFKEFVAQGVQLHVSSSMLVNAQLQVGSATDQITVEANAIQVQTSSAQLGEIVNGDQVRELPLNGRSMTALTLLQPGVSPLENLDTQHKGLQSGSDLSVNGNPVTNNLWLVDGANNNDLGSNRTILIYPSLDSIAEFKFLTNSYGPEYGQASGGIINITTRSGTNNLHGSVYYFGRNDKLNATEYFARQGELALEAQGAHAQNDGKDVLRYNNWGFAVGGPIKKDKLFFFWSEEWQREIRGATRSACVPTLAERQGDFTNVSCGAGVPHLPGNSAVTITNLNQVPGFTGVDKAGSLFASLLPLPNVTPSPATNNKNWFQSLSGATRWRQDNIRADYHVTTNNTATFRYTQDTWSNPSPTHQPIYWGDDIFPAVEGNWSQPSKSVVGKLTTVLGSTVTNDVQFSYSNNRIFATLGGIGTPSNDPNGQKSAQELVAAINAAIPTVFPSSQKSPGGLPVAWGGFGSYGDGQNLWLISPWENSSDLYQFKDDLAKVYGSHTFKTGFFFGYNGKNEPAFGGQDRPQFSLSSSLTGNPLADALLPGTTYGIGENSVTLFPSGRWKDIEFYVQDTWKARRNLTLEYGFRWSFLRQPYELDNQITSWNPAFYSGSRPTTDACNGLVVVPGTDPCGDANKTLGTAFSSGTPGVNRALVENNNHAIAPRLGISWDPWGDGKTAIRAGAGQFFQRERVSTVTNLLGQNAPLSLNYNVTRTLDVAPVLGVPSGSPTAGRDPRGDLPNSWQWNITVEREFARNTNLSLAYVGNRGIHLTSDFDVNAVTPQNRVAYTFAPGNSLRQFTNFNAIQWFAHTGDSNYNALQAFLRSQVTKRTQIGVSYTWSKTIADVNTGDSSGSGFAAGHTFSDAFNPGLDRGTSELNRPHSMVINALIGLPTLESATPFVRNAFGDWEFGTIFTAASGTNVWIKGPQRNINDANGGTISDPTGTGLNDAGPSQGNAMRLLATGVPCDEGRNGSQLWNPAAFTLVGYRLGTIEGTGRGYCPGPRVVNLDLSVKKNWKLTERVGLQFRLEAFNALNHAQFLINGSQQGWLGGNIACGNAPCSPTNNVVTAVVSAGGNPAVQQNFGQARSTRGPREVQYGLKVTF